MMNWEAFEAVGTWVGAFGTVGALLLGFRILRDDRSDKRSAQARQVAVWIDSIVPIPMNFGSLHVWNRSDKHISDLRSVDMASLPTLLDSFVEYWQDPSTRKTVAGTNLLPGQQVETSWPPPARERSIDLSEASASDPAVEFKDAGGNCWRYHLRTRQLSWQKAEKSKIWVAQKWNNFQRERHMDRLMKRRETER